MYKNYIKRLFDIFFALGGIIILFPVLFSVIVLLLFSNHGKPFFIQIRPGKNGKPFKLIKFKTMYDIKDSFGNLLSDNERLTKIGSFIRSTSLDELPQLINVFKGDMALIGPRPLLMKYLPLYTSEQMRRHMVRPGITGWAQVHGRNLCLLSKKFEYDLWYVDNLSLWIDLKIIFKTLMYISNRKDVGMGSCNMLEVDDLNFRKRYNQ